MTQTGDATLIYDEVGNLIEKRRGGSAICYSYDPDNRLIAVESKEGGRVEFVYDAFGRRIAKTTKDGAFGFLWDGDVLLAEERGERSKEYIFEPGSFAPLCRFDEDGFEAYHNDHLGTPRELTDERGQVVWSARYDVYGRVDQLQADRTENQLCFQGQYKDYEAGLFYNRFRYYDPEIGRYITQDPIGVGGGLNLYAYARNPITWIDPLGLAECSGNLPDVSLGKGKDLLDFSEGVRAKSYKEWFGSGLVNRPVDEVNFGRPFYRASYRTGRIKFNLEGVDIEAALSMDNRLARSINPVKHLEIGGKDLVTEWELRQVLQNKRLFEKTEFYYGPHVKFTPEEAGSMGLKYLGK